jgi:hypothetical protein
VAAAAFGTAGSGRSSGRLLFLSNWEKEDLLDLSFSYSLRTCTCYPKKKKPSTSKHVPHARPKWKIYAKSNLREFIERQLMNKTKKRTSNLRCRQ